MEKESLDNLCVNTLRFLAVDAVEAANSGHPGMPLGSAAMGYILWDRFLKHDPKNPKWFNRDRFVLSPGHGSMLLYSLLHLTGYDLSLEDIKNFRQWGSKTPGHPEFVLTPGVECTTGPLGQGFAMGIGMAMAEKYLSAQFNKPDFPVLDHYTYAIVSDGDLMEGVSSEAASLAGHLGLGKVIYLYDDNSITIDGSTDLTFTEDTAQRFKAYGWHIGRVDDGNDLHAITMAIKSAQAETHRPSLLMIKTHIGYGSPKQDTSSVHGEPLGPDSTRQTKENLSWPIDEKFFIPDHVVDHFQKAIERGSEALSNWGNLMETYRMEYPRLAKEFEQVMSGKLPEGWEQGIPRFSPGDGFLATRDASGKILNAIASKVGNLVGGSADLATSNKTFQTGKSMFGLNEKWGPNIHFGTREHAMGAISNGMALHVGILPYTGTFLIFSDYMRPALRLSAIMNAHIIFIFTHDSIQLGEDGPTHQPVEQLMSLRIIPNFRVIRPADANETAIAWELAIKLDGPTALILTRQKLPILDVDMLSIEKGVSNGAYILSDPPEGNPDVILIATGSEVHLATTAKEELTERGINVRVISMPCWELFEESSEDYQKLILPPDIPKLAIEAGSTLGWRKYVGNTGDIIGLDRFGASAPGSVVYEKLGFNVLNVVERVLSICLPSNK
ncbi:MAG: transketolase [Candidatus Marinimicrobia bacterium]|nr:transketolase [Candidatus Neomarinimicrobiota bacterium]